MRTCNCILAGAGRCCQNHAEEFNYATSTSGSMDTYGLPRRVRKSMFLGLNSWTVTNHPLGTKSFRTWREAMQYASAPYLMVNELEPFPAPMETGLPRTAYC